MVAGLVLVALVVSAVGAGRWGRSWSAPLAAASIVWLLTNHEVEGPVLVEVTDSRGLVAADLAGLAGVLLALLVVVFDKRS